MSLRSNWKSYDFRAITAGIGLLVIALLMLWGTPTWTIECDRQANRCDLRSSTRALQKTTKSIDLSTIVSARENCHRGNPSKPCNYTVDLVLKQGRAVAFADISKESVAKGLAESIREFIVKRDVKQLRLHNAADRGFNYAVFILSALMVFLGVRKNMQSQQTQEPAPTHSGGSAQHAAQS
jgi:hypothetical protein